jgi:hypothetical protein
MKLEVGMYIRTNWGDMCKLISINEFREPNMKYGVEASYLSDIAFIGDEHIVKARYNMIDLIEAGDYVNGVEVAFIDELTNEIAICETDLTTRDFEGRYAFKRIKKEDIKSIVTKEKFKSMEYKVVQDNENIN